MNQDIEIKQCQEILRKNNLYPIKKLGKGAFGMVFLVSRATSKSNLCQLLSVKCTNKKNFAKKPMLRRYLKQEIDIQANSEHPNLVKLIHTIEDEGWNFMLLEYCDLGNLYTIQSHKPKRVFELNEAKKYMADVLDGLEYLHSHSIIHRDLKSENILLAKDPKTQEIRAKLCDFGFAKEVEDEASTFCGTTYFMAPEIFAKKKYDASVDIWASGVIFFHMLFAVYPFKSINMAAEIQSKCKKGFSMEQVKGIDLSLIPNQDKNNLNQLFANVFRLNPDQRISLQELRKFMRYEDTTKPMEPEDETDSDEEAIEFITQKIFFIQKVYQEVKYLNILSNLEELAFKYYLDKYCLTLLLRRKRVCNANPNMNNYKNEIISNQEKDAGNILCNIDKMEIPRLAQVFSPQICSDFTAFKQAYRIVLSHIFSKASKQIEDQVLRSQIKLKIFCCHSINRVFDKDYVRDVFVHFFAWGNRKSMKGKSELSPCEFKLSDISRWIQQDSVEKVNDTVRILCDMFYRKSK